MLQTKLKLLCRGRKLLEATAAHVITYKALSNKYNAHTPYPQLSATTVTILRTKLYTAAQSPSPMLGYQHTCCLEKLQNLNCMALHSKCSRKTSSLNPGNLSRSRSEGEMGGQRRRSCDRPDPPKTSCSSSYYSSTSHYNEAIADCIEFLNKS
ncbi:hypothetical protein RND71_035327 [Anisodus tanguticus]|uniref:Uncharacterized protein n=1 Tax=Anisodus tanguticus TaxID=243964 RepID=A0AAE1R4Q0_9SOLA|nr:hypothetical protein RND71_035327 [Anisodus tanguticus]